MVKANVWIMETKFAGAPKPSDFKTIEKDLPSAGKGEIVTEAKILSCDPYNRAFAAGMPAGSPMLGFQAAKVIDSQNDAFPVGCHVVTHAGWRTHAHLDHTTGDPPFNFAVYRIPDHLLKHPLSYFVGVLGMPGATAYFGLIEHCQPKKGETLVVNAAAGAVGSLVGQYAKILGLKVIGYAGTDAKCAWLKSLGFDHAVNYKTNDLDASLTELAPEGVDCYYDNVGGEFSVTVYNHMNRYGRICQTGAISAYNATGPVKISLPHGIFVAKELILKGFMFSTFVPRYQEFIDQVAQWIDLGRVKTEETPYDGFCSMPQALIDQLDGKNTGKVVVYNNCDKDGLKL